MGGDSTMSVLFRNGLLIDGSGPEPSGEVDVLVENGKVVAVSSEPLEAGNATEYDLAGRAIMPGWPTR